MDNDMCPHPNTAIFFLSFFPVCLAFASTWAHHAVGLLLNTSAKKPDMTMAMAIMTERMVGP